MDNENKKIAEKIFKAIKKSLSDARKYNKENNLPIHVFNMDIMGNLKKVITGENIGTVVTP